MTVIGQARNNRPTSSHTSISLEKLEHDIVDCNDISQNDVILLWSFLENSLIFCINSCYYVLWYLNEYCYWISLKTNPDRWLAVATTTVTQLDSFNSCNLLSCRCFDNLLNIHLWSDWFSLKYTHQYYHIVLHNVLHSWFNLSRYS